jgi:hypothetical protein
MFIQRCLLHENKNERQKKNIYRFLITTARPTAAAKTALPIATYVHQLLLLFVVLFSIYKSYLVFFIKQNSNLWY